MKAVIYARYSSDLQSEASIEDQIAACRKRAEREGWQVVNCYTDHSISGASLMRPGLQAMMQDSTAGRFDIVLAEALDRLSRDQEDVAGLYKRLQFANVKIFTLSEGEISNLHIGLKGTMNALFLKDLADKTRRGLSGRIEKGKSGGGITFGYDVVKAVDAAGEAVRGEREINEQEAAIVRRIFSEFARGESPKAIAHRLNAEKVPGPQGKEWGPSTIYGNRRRGTGIINNELYIGRLIWNRLRYIKDPDTGKRVSRLNPEEDWIIRDVPELRIVDDALWDSVKARQKKLDEAKPKFWETQRPRYLFSYLLKCGCCGGGYGKISKDRLGCSTYRNKGTCDNGLTIKQDDVETAVLGALKDNLMDPMLCEVFCQEYTNHLNTLRIQHNAALSRYRAEMEKVAQEKEKLVQAILDGVSGALLKDKFERNEARRVELQALLDDTQEAPVLLHPNMARRYQEEVRNLITALNSGDNRAEAAELLRSLIDRIVLSPDKGGERLQIDLIGDLAGILQMATKTGKPQDSAALPVQQVKLVAGVGFEPTTFRL